MGSTTSAVGSGDERRRAKASGGKGGERSGDGSPTAPSVDRPDDGDVSPDGASTPGGPRRSRRPKAEVVAAILDAADDLFAERSPAAVSLREIADRAGVQHSLIHRHFGTKEELLRSVIERASLGFRASLVGDDLTEASLNGYRYMLDRPTLIRVMIQLVLDGEDPRRYLVQSHGLNRYSGLVAEEQAERPGRARPVDLPETSSTDAEDGDWPAGALPPEAVVLGAFSIGAVVAESWLLAANGMEQVTAEQFRAAVERAFSVVVPALLGTVPD